MSHDQNEFDLEYSDHPPYVEMLTARFVALEILTDVLGRKLPLDQIMEDKDSYRHLETRDRAFVRMLVATTLRRCGQIDDMIRRAMDKGQTPNPLVLLNILRLGVAQLMFMNVPDYAVVDTAVRMTEEAALGRQKGFVNAVLRRTAREGHDWIIAQDPAMLNIPDWLMQEWVADYGPDVAVDIALASLTEAPLDISIKDPSHRDYWAETLEAEILPTGGLRRLSGGAIHVLPGFDDGMWWVQDASASIPAQLMGRIDGQHVIDLCAAPGGKTAQLAALGAQVLALDRSTRRLQRLHDNMHRLRLDTHVTAEAADATVWHPKDPVHYILLDAPCSATGTIRRHPDVLHNKSPVDSAKLINVQARLLDNVAGMLATGGVMIYCTCSLQKSEGEAQVNAFLTRHKNFARKPVEAVEIGGLAQCITPQGDVRILPQHYAAHGGMDGFYVARLVKN